MRLFLIKLFVGVSLLIIFLWLWLLVFTKGHSVDEYYVRFTTSPAKSFILGGSRAAMGLSPSVFANSIGSRFEGPLINYGFTLHQGVYGPWYLEAIKRKLDYEARNGIFILCVDPWTLNHLKSDSSDSESLFREKGSFLSRMHFPNMNPNIEYLLFHYNRPLINLFFGWLKPPSSFILHSDGWFEQLKLTSDTLALLESAEGKAYGYTEYWAKENKLSDCRFLWLEKTVKYLQEHGTVIVVRLPTSDLLANLEKKLYPEFDGKIKKIAVKTNAKYINFIEDSKLRLTFDGNHLHPKVAKKYSTYICDSLKFYGLP